ncbi:FkbM family methyltransferase [Mycolicibacterium sp. P1-18]|uniref:FkbM family methyltransferase n=1 Tax=Mycolicibacterium sp. P1-18 TaxID=2024615 RepID=UPI0011F1A2D8|nr:FkbM family methyltransferase [Mycolicibacterium sp. P1-18]KAA0098108.1 FkbM family methyltransferase [Mycolicibacterium sp. P1-18]
MGSVRRLKKLFLILASRDRAWWRALVLGVPAGVEHGSVLRSLECSTVVDVGANRGQFALAARRRWPAAQVMSFEPLDRPASTFRRVFSRDPLTTLHEFAIGPREDVASMHLSRSDDSSSLLAITRLQDTVFPGTDEIGTVDVRVAPLAAFVNPGSMVEPALLKIDVQGYELEVLRGCEPLLSEFTLIYCECSFVELYEGQGLAGDVVRWLADHDFTMAGVFNAAYDDGGRAVQADFLFTRSDAEPQRDA